MNDEHNAVKSKASSFNIHHSSFAADSSSHKKQFLTSPYRLEQLASLALAISVLVFLGMSFQTLYQFPVPDSYRWYGDETQTWMLLGWKNLFAHGKLIVPIGLESMLERSPGLFLGSSWFPALWYGLPQLLAPSHVDPVSIGRTVTFVFALLTLLVIGFTCYRLKISASLTALCIALIATTRTFTFASHSARYDMITGFAVTAFIAFFAVRAQNSSPPSRTCSRSFAFFLGFAALMAAFIVSPHTGMLLLLPVMFIASYFGVIRNIWNFFSLLTGAITAFAMLAGAYLAANHNLVLAGLTMGDNQASSYLDHLPVLHFFSRNAQVHQLGPKLYYLLHEAPTFVIVLPLILLSAIALFMRKVQHASTFVLTACLAGVLFGAAFLQNTLPYYLSYYVPLAGLTFAAHANEWRKFPWLPPLTTVVSFAVVVGIFAIGIPELDHAGQIGKHIDDTNIAAIHTAIEIVKRDWEPNVTKPLILAQGPAVHELLRDTTVRVMSESFIFFPLPRERNQPLQTTDSVFAHAGVAYAIDYNKPMTSEYEMAVRRGTPIFSRIGPLLDRTVDYFQDSTIEIDTLTLYRINSHP